MKRVLLSTAVLFLVGVAAKAQDVKFGAKAGINIAKIKASGGGTTVSSDSKVGLNAGGFAEIPVSESFFVQPELYFSQMGGKSGSDKLNLSYISLPVLAKYNFSGLGVYAGPQIGLLLSAKDKSNGVTTDVKNEFKGADFSGVAGAEYTFDPGIVLSARYQFGLSDIQKNSTGGGTVKNNAFQVTIGYIFGGSSSK